MRSSVALRLFTVLIAALLNAVALPARAVEKGSEQVSPFYGSFSYAVPIEVPPFRGLEPRLALGYSSEGRNGLVGVGWGLSGFGNVERTNAGGGTPRWDGTDVYRLEGQKLLVCQGGMTTPSCTTGGTHATETESFRRVRFDAPTNSWTVWDPSGVRSVYTSIMTSASGTYRWGLASVIDTKNNTVAYQWQCNTDCYPSSVTYGPYAITFFREARPDAISFGRGTDLGRTAERLLSVIVYAPGVGHIRGYKLAYALSTTSGRSLLTSVQQYGKDLVHANGVLTSGSTLPAQVFTYTQDSIAKSFASQTPAPPTPPGTTEPASWAERKNTTPTGSGSSLQRTGGDPGWTALGSSTRALVSGDGYLEVTAGSDGGKRFGLSRKTKDFLPEEIDYAFQEASGTYHAATVWDKGIDRGTFPAPAGSLLRIEVSNGAVLYKVAGTTVYTRPAGGKIGYPLVAAAIMSINNAVVQNAVLSGALQDSSSWCWGDTLLTADFNGDGKTDQACYTTFNQTVRVSLSTGTSFAAPTVWRTETNFSKPVVGDFNNDGKSDLAAFAPFAPAAGDFWVSLSSGSAFGTPVNWGHAAGTMPNGFPANCETPYVALGAGDFNGDGRLDVSCRPAQWGSPSPSPILIGVSNGTSFSFSVWGDLGCDFPAYQSTGSIDFDADGKDDWYCKSQSGDFHVYVSTGTQFIYPAFGTLDHTFCGSRYVLGDFNGDGRVDAHCADNGKVALSTGRSFAVQGGGTAWCPVLAGEETPTTQVFAADVDGDGLSEIVCNNGAGSANDIQVRKWTDAGLGTAETWKTSWCEGQLHGGDFNGDGKTDLLCDNLGTPVAFAGTGGQVVDLMAGARSSLGGLTGMAYTATSNFTNVNNPPVRYALTSLTLDDGHSGPVTRTHAYSGGYMDRIARRFLGFQYARTTKPCLAGESSCPYEESWFLQDAIAGPRLQRSESRAGSGQLLGKSTLEYAGTATTAPYTQMLTGAWSYTYGASGGSKRSYATTAYDAYGNVTELTEHGDYDIAGDERTTVRQYLANTTAFIVNRPSSQELRTGVGTNGQLQSQSLFGYDGLNVGTAPTAGYVTSSGRWIDTSNSYETTSVQYDAWGNRSAVTDPSSATALVTVDAAYHLFPVEVRNSLGEAHAAQWDLRCAAPRTTTDANAVTITIEYDAFCRVESRDSVLGSFERYSYLSLGDPASQRARIETPSASFSDGTGNYFSQTYFDGFGRAFRSEAKGPSPSQTIVAEVGYNSRGAISWRREPYYAGAATGPATNYYYDGLDRTTRVEFLGNPLVEVAYGPWQVSVTNSAGHTVSRHLDAFGRLLKSEEYDDEGRLIAVQHAYNTRGERTGTSDPAGNIWSWTYDSLGRLHTRSDPDSGAWTYAYDTLERRTTQTDANGRTAQVETDAAGRPIRRTTSGPGGSTVTFGYDEPRSGYFNVGRATSMTDAHGSEQYDYDALGRQVRQVRGLDQVNYAFEWRYGPSGQLTGVTFPDGDAVGSVANPIVYDGAGRLRAVPGVVVGVQYDAAGRPVERSNSNGTITTWQYDDRGTLRHITTTASAGLVQDLTYTPDLVGRTTTVASPFPNESWSYGYDALGRLGTATNLWDPAHSQAFQYGPVGNKTYDSRVGQISYPAPGSPLAHAPSVVAGETMQYDANGNLLSGRGRTFEWSPDNQPTMVNGVILSYAGDGRRIKKVSGGSTSIYPLGNDYEVKDGLITKYISLGNGLLAKRVGGVTYWLHVDRLGSVQAITDALGHETLRGAYRPYGESITQGTSHWEPLGYIGQRLDEETGLQYLHARYYDPALGIFLSPDPAQADLNGYGYSFGDPINLSDPSGLVPECWALPPPQVGAPYRIPCPGQGQNDGQTGAGSGSSGGVPWIIQQWLNGWIPSPLGSLDAAASPPLLIPPTTGDTAPGPVDPGEGSQGPVDPAPTTGTTGPAGGVGAAPGQVPLGELSPNARAIVEGLNHMNLGANIPKLLAVPVVLGTGLGAFELAGGLGTAATYTIIGTGVPVGIAVSPRGMQLVSTHLARFGAAPENVAMLGRLRVAQDAGWRLQGADANFYLHEAAEATMMGQGMSYAEAHALALSRFGISPYALYHPGVISAFPELFNPRYRSYWGIP